MVLLADADVVEEIILSGFSCYCAVAVATAAVSLAAAAAAAVAVSLAAKAMDAATGLSFCFFFPAAVDANLLAVR